MKWLDLPPFWLLACLALAWGVPWRAEVGLAGIVGWGLLGLAVVLVVLAVIPFVRTGTTIVPRRQPTALIRSGIYRVTRNPIYLADVLILLGASLIWGSLLGLVLVPVFAVLLERRFIRGEEAALHTAFGAAFEKYTCETRRWL